MERLDDPSLVGVPLAVQQFNSGGFVAVSYEARAGGVRCGDGVGAGGRCVVTCRRFSNAALLELRAVCRCLCGDWLVHIADQAGWGKRFELLCVESWYPKPRYDQYEICCLCADAGLIWII